ncbi:SMP-30/gluconolactonase/LRE family protein [Micrococcus sp.]|uniref:SMP-30/gluconolactonase/LRE family protein n=1 Tax=Micrococcus sp. TaxID=1271 RepID=UPI002A90D38E|nr:SMP-30/gluconolactonase/LRE family protein [Micrococcus sp.]MDY6056000.1 SMP-30/gluconolactonase/LRE family protein [Micrococcus sp.]
MRAEQVTDPIVFHGEGPVWSESWGGLRWVDMLAGDYLTLREDGTVDRTGVDEAVCAVVRPRVGGGAVIAVERGFVLEEADGTQRRLPPVWEDPNIRMNEGGCDPDGRFYAGTMAYDRTEGAGSLYRLDPSGEVTVVLEGVSTSNGLEWSPDGSLAYYNDTPTRQVAVFDYSREEGLTGRRVFTDVLGGEGKPDGLTVDAEGGVWVAAIGSGKVLRYSPEGTLDEVLELPVSRPTAVTFGGPDLDRLYITTTREKADLEAEPLSGCLFVAEPGVRGLPVRPFAG